jgi:AcrR family transcriptional regulator
MDFVSWSIDDLICHEAPDDKPEIIRMNQPNFRDHIKNKVIDVSRELLRENGLAGLQARKIADASGCSVGTIYNLYGNLDTVIIVTNTGTLGDLRDALIRVDHEGQGVAQRLEALALAYLDFAVDRNNEWRAVFEHRFADKTVVPDWYRDTQTALFGLVETILESAIAVREQRQEAARALFAAVHGIVSLSLDEKLCVFERAAVERQIRFVITTIARGLESQASS